MADGRINQFTQAALTVGLDLAKQGSSTDVPGGDALEIGSTVNGRYRVLRVLGHGGQGWVYDVADALFPNRAVALKVTRGLSDNRGLLSLFEREFSTMTRLDHPNVARVYDYEPLRGSDDFLITMERVDGVPIDRALQGKRDWRPVVEHIVQVCRALSYVHSRRIVHHDLKPHNILVDAQGNAKVVDFGIARGPATPDGRAMGTIWYMPRELLLGEERVDHRADLYSLGITLYELLFGAVPCNNCGLVETIRWMSAGGVRAVPTTSIPVWLARVIEQLCAQDPADRYRNANAVIEAINAGGGFSYPFETSETRESYIVTPRFSGRNPEFERVLRFISARLDGAGGTTTALWVRGVSGMGKSRLMKEVRQSAQLQGLAFIEGNCYENSLIEYAPLAEALYQLVPLVELSGGADIVVDALPALVKIAPRLAKGRTYQPLPATASPDGERVQVLTLTAEFFVRAAARIPFGLYVNDMQWAGRGPAQMFLYLARRASDDEASGERVHFALIGSYRSDEIDGRPLAQAVDSMHNAGLAIDVDLEPLAGDDVATIVRSMLGVDDVPQAFLSRVATETEGNPFFVQEVMRELLDNGSIYLDGGRWAARQEVEALEIPATMAEAFRRRLLLLSAEEKELVRVIAVHGRPLELERIREVLHGGANRDRLLDMLVALEQRTIVVKHTVGRALAWNIVHDHMRETLYGDLPPDERRRLHRQLGDALEAASLALPDEDRPLDDMARHYREASVNEKALDYAIRAGKRALRQFANEAATDNLMYALTLMVEEDHRYAETLEDAADALTRVNRYDDALASYDRVLQRVHERVDVARVQGKVADILFQTGKLEEAEDAAWGTLEAFGERRPRGRAAWLLATLGALWSFAFHRLAMPRLARVRSQPQFVGDIYHQLAYNYVMLDQLKGLATALLAWRATAASPDLAARAIAKGVVGTFLGFGGFMGIGRALCGEAVSDAERSGSARAIGYALTNRGMLVRYDGPKHELEDHERGASGLERAGDLYGAYAARAHVAFYHWMRGDVNAAVREATQSRQHVLRLTSSPIAVSLLAMEAMFRTHQMTTSEEEIDVLFARAEELALAARDRFGRLQLLRMRGISRCASGETAEGVADLEHALKERLAARDITNYTFEVFVRLPYAYLQLPSLTSDQEHLLAKAHATAMRSTATLHRNYRPRALLNEALIRERKREHAKADRFFAEAVAVARTQESHLAMSDALCEWGAVQLRRGNRSGAEACLREAREIAAEGGNRLLVRRCAELSSGNGPDDNRSR